MFASLHKDIVDAASHSIDSIWFCESDSNRGAINIYTTHVMGKFRCPTKTCRTNSWASRKVAILIRGFAENGYNAVVFNQRCKACNKLGDLTLDEKSYIDRVAYRVQKWAGIPMHQQYYARQRGKPHEREFCEGCKRGVCRQTNDYEYD